MGLYSGMSIDAMVAMIGAEKPAGWARAEQMWRTLSQSLGDAHNQLQSAAATLVSWESPSAKPAFSDEVQLGTRSLDDWHTATATVGAAVAPIPGLITATKQYMEDAQREYYALKAAAATEYPLASPAAVASYRQDIADRMAKLLEAAATQMEKLDNDVMAAVQTAMNAQPNPPDWAGPMTAPPPAIQSTGGGPAGTGGPGAAGSGGDGGLGGGGAGDLGGAGDPAAVAGGDPGAGGLGGDVAAAAGAALGAGGLGTGGLGAGGLGAGGLGGGLPGVPGAPGASSGTNGSTDLPALPGLPGLAGGVGTAPTLPGQLPTLPTVPTGPGSPTGLPPIMIPPIATVPGAGTPPGSGVLGRDPRTGALPRLSGLPSGGAGVAGLGSLGAGLSGAAGASLPGIGNGGQVPGAAPGARTGLGATGLPASPGTEPTLATGTTATPAAAQSGSQMPPMMPPSAAGMSGAGRGAIRPGLAERAATTTGRAPLSAPEALARQGVTPALQGRVGRAGRETPFGMPPPPAAAAKQRERERAADASANVLDDELWDASAEAAPVVLDRPAPARVRAR